MAFLLYSARRYGEAAQVIQKFQSRLPNQNDLNQLASEVSLRTQDYTHAIEQARKPVAADSKDYRDYLWLGYVLAAAKHEDEVGPVLRKAVALGGEAPETWIALVQHLVRTGKKADAEAAIEEAKKKLPPAQAPRALAQCYLLVGRRNRAGELYKAALEKDPNDLAVLRDASVYAMLAGQPKEAEEHLRKMVDQKKSPAEAGWARRVLAVLMASGGNYQKSLEALKILSPSDEIDPGQQSVGDLRARAKVLALQPGARRGWTRYGCWKA